MSLQQTQSAQSLLRYLSTRLGIPEPTFASLPERLHGGFDTDLFRIELRGTADVIPATLVIRVYRAHHSPHTPAMEGLVQNAVADAKRPAPRVHLVCDDVSVLGQPFIAMDLMPGEPLITYPEASPTILGAAQADLHQIGAAFTLADPLFDVAGTMMLFDINGRHLARGGEAGLDDIDSMLEAYLSAYRSGRALNEAHLDYYMTLRCAVALMHGLRRPGSRPVAVSQDLATRIRELTGIEIPLGSTNTGT